LLFPLSTPNAAVLNRVGGKAASLIRLQQAGFDVPDGVVLTTRFFEPWLAEIRTTSEWRSVIEMLQGNGTAQPNQQRADLAQSCERLKALASALPVTANQRAQIDAIEPRLGTGPYAVRSSSPEEDLAGASFAGLYETVLGVDSGSLSDAIRTCFCSCLDERVLLYKAGMNFESLAPAIAVVVQRLVASDISGVAFSLNPLTNDFDEILINAS
jgi:phosphoenolpyruvate synthase/pyruvate phosphate dikinase